MTWDPRTPARAKSPGFGSFQMRPSHLLTGAGAAGPISEPPSMHALRPASPAEARAAALVVCDRADTPEDARALLAMLGLDVSLRRAT